MSLQSPKPGPTGEAFVVGVDFGTLSGRAVVVRVRDGAELGTAVTDYPHAVLDRALPDGRPLPPEWALQVPADYVEVLRTAVPAALVAAGVDPRDVIGIGTDFTACTMVATTADGTPLCELPELAGEPHAYVKLWRHHAAQPQADRINELARKRSEPWLPRYGGLISSEWEFAKGLQMVEEAPARLRRDAALGRGRRLDRLAAHGNLRAQRVHRGLQGHPAGRRVPVRGVPPRAQPRFRAVRRRQAGAAAGQARRPRGRSLRQAAAWTGLPEGIAVAVGNVDAHVTAPAAKAVEPGVLVAIMGTSTCHVMNGAQRRDVAGMCGVVDGGIVPGLWGYEAGQSGVGDIFGWFTAHGVPPSYHDTAEARGISVHTLLTELAAGQLVGEHGLVALDWHSGNRSVLVDHELSGVVVGQTLSTRAEDTYRALLEATAFGTRRIIEAFTEAGVPVDELVVAGGLLKNPLLMQIYADVTNLPLSTIGSEQGPALGSAIHAAVAAGCYPDIRAAAAAMGSVHRAVYQPVPANVAAYDDLYAEYLALHDYFGRGANDVMHRLKARRRAVAGAPDGTAA